jgi:hypothetical protein
MSRSSGCPEVRVQEYVTGSIRKCNRNIRLFDSFFSDRVNLVVKRELPHVPSFRFFCHHDC